MNLAAAGHEIHVITRQNNRHVIETALGDRAVPRLYFHYYDLPPWARGWKRGGRGVHLYYFLWQWGAFRMARKLCRRHRFDLAHHISFGVFRQPSFMAFLGLPFIFGPVGGGECAPQHLRRSFPFAGKAIDLLRDLANAWAKWDPLMHAVFRRASIILCKTHETLAAIPRRYQAKCRVQLEIGTTTGHSSNVSGRSHERGNDKNAGLRVLFVGRLVYLKGLHLALPAFAQLLHQDTQARFTIVGSGPERARLQQLSEQLGIAQAIDWIPWLSQSKVFEIYPQYDVLLFPSLHDSSGNAVLEALSFGVPVVCLNLGGPGFLVNEQCGIPVPADDEPSAIAGLTEALRRLAANRSLRQSMAQAAAVRADEFSWHRQIEAMNQIYAVATRRTEPAERALP
ncbi:MAG: glycosyltransferase family 4 protein [Gammaproteobacteria bacterium]|nr:glycosyltransferase family 4 protein [Gammaproteobacteria bacterium]